MDETVKCLGVRTNELACAGQHDYSIVFGTSAPNSPTCTAIINYNHTQIESDQM